jgi:hypothetical protein
MPQARRRRDNSTGLPFGRTFILNTAKNNKVVLHINKILITSTKYGNSTDVLSVQA